MSKKDIALTVGGIVAGLALTYLLYRLEQNSAATNAANAAAAADAAAQASQDEQLQQYDLASSLPSVSVSSLGTDTTTAPSTDSTGSDGYGDTADAGASTLLSNIIADFAGAVTSQNGGEAVNASIIPTLDFGQPSTVLDAVPITAGQAQAGVPSNTIITPPSTNPTASSPSPVTVPVTSGIAGPGGGPPLNTNTLELVGAQ